MGRNVSPSSTPTATTETGHRTSIGTTRIRSSFRSTRTVGHCIPAPASSKIAVDRMPATKQSIFHYLLKRAMKDSSCLLYTSDAADEEDSVDLGGRRIL